MDDERSYAGGKLKLYRRSGIWQARVYIGDKKYFRRTLKTSALAEAEQAGLQLLYETQFKLKEGLPVQSRSFNDVIDEYIVERERDNKIGNDAKRGSSIKHTSDTMLRQIKRVSKFWKEYTGKRAVDAVDDKVLRGFIPWRKTYYHKREDIHHNAKLDPTDKTLQFDLMIGKMILKYAQDQNYRGNKPFPKFAFTPKIKRVRPHFTAQEFRRLCTALRKWVDGTKNPAWKQSRQLLHDYVYTLGMAGLRTGEANNLRIRDVAPIVDIDGRPTIQLYVRGKTGERTVQPHIELAPILLQRRNEDKPNDWLFAMPSGSKIINLIDQFNTFLKHVGLTHTGDGAKYSLYSLRHYYAVRSLGRADIHSIAQNMGTSVKMIEQYYGKHGISPERARRLAGNVGDAERAYDPVVYERKPKLKTTGKRDGAKH